MHIGKDIIWKGALEDSWSFAAIYKKSERGSRAVQNDIVNRIHVKKRMTDARTISADKPKLQPTHHVTLRTKNHYDPKDKAEYVKGWQEMMFHHHRMGVRYLAATVDIKPIACLYARRIPIKLREKWLS